MPSTTVTNIIDIAATDISGSDEVDIEFVRGAARYLRNAGLNDEAITVSLVDELGIDISDAQRITLTL